MKFAKKSIAAKISILIIILVMITASFVGMIFYYGGNKVLVQREFEKIELKTKEIGYSLRLGISELKRDTRTLAHIVSHKKNLVEIENWKEDIHRMIKLKHSYLSVQILDNNLNSKEFYERNTSRVDLKNNKDSTLKNLKKYNSKIERLEENKVFLTDIWLNKSENRIEKSHRRILYSLSPIFGKKGREGYLALKFDFADLFKEMKGFANSNESIFISNSKGDYLIHPQKLKTFGFNLGIRYKIGDDFPVLEERKDSKFETEKGHDYITNYQNQKFLIHMEKIFLSKDNKDNYFNLTIGISYDDVIGSSNVIRTRSFYLAFVLIILTALVGWFTTKYLTKHLDRITEMAQRYSRGETDIHIPVESKDEIGVLSLTFQGMLREVNERTRILKKNERELREARDRTEQSLKEKNELLDDLKKQKEEIERVSKDKDELLAIVSHDLKNPLAVIETSMDILMEDEAANHDEMTTDLIRRAKNSSAFALNLITDLLEVARLEGGIRLELEKFPIKEMISSVLDGFFLKAQAKNISMETRITGEFEIYADYGRFIQVLNNIIGNSLKFTPKNGKIIIHIFPFEGRIKRGDPGRFLKIIIEDNGPGIPVDKIDIIFNKFEQARVKDRKIGTGLGLVISKNIMTLHNGNIRVESVKGKGAKFFITLPRLIEESVKKPDIEKSKNFVKNEDIKLLLVDDSEDIQMLFKVMLRKENFSLSIASNGQEGLELFKVNKFDIILMDIKMPVMDGNEAIKKMRIFETENSQEITSIYAISSNHSKDDIKLYLKNGFTGSASKPLKKDKILQLLKERKAS